MHIQGIAEIVGIPVDKPVQIVMHGYEHINTVIGKHEPQGMQDVAHTHISRNIEVAINER